MTSTSETGHAKNVANFDQLISSVSGFGATYNPSRTAIQLSSLQALSASARAALNGVSSAQADYSNAVAAREVKFQPLSKLATRILNAIKATDTTSSVDDNVKTLIRKIQGVKATPKLTGEDKKALAAEGKETKEISSSQLSFDSLLENFNKLIQLLVSIPQYAPNEEELKVITLTAQYNEMKTLNDTVVTTATALSNARIARNEVLYKENTGLVDIAADVKTYIKSLFGTSAPQFKQVSKLEFSPYKA
jgi:hypothetical protein